MRKKGGKQKMLKEEAHNRYSEYSNINKHRPKTKNLKHKNMKNNKRNNLNSTSCVNNSTYDTSSNKHKLCIR